MEAQNEPESAAEQEAPAFKNTGQGNLDLYEPDARKSVVVPGTNGALSGTAFTEWVDADGNLAAEHNNPVDPADLPAPPKPDGPESTARDE